MGKSYKQNSSNFGLRKAKQEKLKNRHKSNGKRSQRLTDDKYVVDFGYDND